MAAIPPYLHTYGLLSGAFRPEPNIRRLRSHLRQRAMLVEYAPGHVLHMRKALTQMNVKLDRVISDITGITGMAIAEAVVGGERDPGKLAQFRDCRTKTAGPSKTRGPHPYRWGHCREEHVVELTQALELYRVCQFNLAGCGRETEVQRGGSTTAAAAFHRESSPGGIVSRATLRALTSAATCTG